MERYKNRESSIERRREVDEVTPKGFSSRILRFSILLVCPIALCTQGAEAISREAPLLSESVSSAGNIPLVPIAQPLFPEGALAMELVQALKIGQVPNETEAQIMLSSIGIEPKNGWIADYPVTPDIMAEIEEAVASAAEGKKIPLGKEVALRSVKEIWARLGLNISWNPPAPDDPQKTRLSQTDRSPIFRYVDEKGVVHFTDRYDAIPKEYRGEMETILPAVRPEPPPVPAPREMESASPPTTPTPPAVPAPEVIHHYYISCRPPVITYYPPPLPYVYLYVWVPYPFWCGRFYFSGFFILHDFRRTIYFHRRPFVVTNHFICGRTKIVYRIDPVHRHLGGSKALTRPPSIKLSATPQGQAGAKAILNLHPPKGDPSRKVSTPGIQKPSPSTGPAPGNLAIRAAPLATSQAPQSSNLPQGTKSHAEGVLPPASAGKVSPPASPKEIYPLKMIPKVPQPAPPVKNETGIEARRPPAPRDKEPTEHLAIAQEEKSLFPQKGGGQKLEPSGSHKTSSRDKAVHEIFPIPSSPLNRPNISIPSWGTGPLAGPRNNAGGLGGRGALR